MRSGSALAIAPQVGVRLRPGVPAGGPAAARGPEPARGSAGRSLAPPPFRIALQGLPPPLPAGHRCQIGPSPGDPGSIRNRQLWPVATTGEHLLTRMPSRQVAHALSKGNAASRSLVTVSTRDPPDLSRLRLAYSPGACPTDRQFGERLGGVKLEQPGMLQSDSLPIRWKYRTALADKAEIAGKYSSSCIGMRADEVLISALCG